MAILKNFFLSRSILAIAFFVPLCAWSNIPQSEVLQSIKKSGQIRIGVKTDVAPFSYLSPEGDPIGFEIDLASDIAKRLGVKLVKVPVTTENRFQKLELGDVDMLMATVADSKERRKIATAIEPGYFETGVTVMMRPGRMYQGWESIRGKTICALQGAYFNRPTAERYLINLQTYKTARDAQRALQDGRCEGFLYNRPAITNLLKKSEFDGYSAPFSDALISPWTSFIKKTEAGKDFERFLSETAAAWYREGILLESARRWNIKSGSWPDDENELWNRKRPNGDFACTLGDTNLWSPECRKIEFVSSNELSGLAAFGMGLKEKTGVDLSYVYDQYDRMQLVRGLGYTMLVTALSIVGSLLMGIAAAVVVDRQWRGISSSMHAAMAFGRLVPPLLMMYLLFFGLGGVLLSTYGFQVPALVIAIFCLGYYSGGIVMNGLLAAAQLLRTKDKNYRLTLGSLKETLNYSRWPTRQALINVTKMSMIASALAIPELLSSANLIMAEKGNLAVMMFSIVVAYYLITAFWIKVLGVVEVRVFGVGATDGE